MNRGAWQALYSPWGQKESDRTEHMHNNVLCCSVIKLCPTLRPHGLQHTRLPCPSLSSRVCSNSCPLKLVMPSNHLILCCPLLFLSSIFPSIRVFSSESVLRIKGTKYWSFSFSIRFVGIPLMPTTPRWSSREISLRRKKPKDFRVETEQPQI